MTVFLCKRDNRETEALENLRGVPEAQTGAAQLQVQDAHPVGHQRLGRGEASRRRRALGQRFLLQPPELWEGGRLSCEPSIYGAVLGSPRHKYSLCLLLSLSVNEVRWDEMPMSLCGLLL